MSSVYYFSQETDKHIVLYLEESDPKVKDRIFENHIRPSFEKLIENLIYVYGFFTLDDVDTLSKDALVALYEALPKFNLSKSNKAFSYFNVIGKNWFFQRAREINKKRRLESEVQVSIEQDSLKNESNLHIPSHEDDFDFMEFWTQLLKGLRSWRPKCHKKSEKAVLEAVIFLMENPDAFPIYNKKAIYMYIREYTGLGNKQIKNNLLKICGLYHRWKDQFFTNGVIK